MQYSTHLLRHLRYTIGRNIHAQRSEQKLPCASWLSSPACRSNSLTIMSFR